jgi:hypothetical protein
VVGRTDNVAAVSVGRNGTSETNTQSSDSRFWQQSVRFQIEIEEIA